MVLMKLRYVRAACLWDIFQNQNRSFHSHFILWKNFISLRDQKSCIAVCALMHNTNVGGTSWMWWYYISYEGVTLKHASNVCAECSITNCLLLMHHFQLLSSNAPHQLSACNFITSNFLLLRNNLNCLLLMHHFQLLASNAPHQLSACNFITSNFCF